MTISLIGMSGSGKSYLSKKLESYGFKRYCCDDLIEKKLEKKLEKSNGIQDVARWMGQPYDKQYEVNSKEYLDCEKEVLNEILTEIENDKSKYNNIVIDTTGSVIYTGEEILKKLSQNTKVVYLQVPDKVKEEMYQLYINDPKPVVWGDAFEQKPGEESIDALKRCFPDLLLFRAKKYEELSDIKLDYFQLRSDNFDTENLVNLLDRKI